jgi:hypothetical protein
MKVYITSTPDVEKSLIENVINVLNQTNGDTFQFIANEPITMGKISIYNKGLNENNIITSELSLDEMLDLCSSYKTMNELSDDDFAVILTGIKIKEEWFSAFRKRAIFVDVNNWETLINNDRKYGISHQIFENIFQSLIDLQIEGNLDPLIHKDRPIGCINDFCDEKRDIEYKLMTARICPKCLERAYQKIENPLIIKSIQSQFESIRKLLMTNTENIQNVIPPIIIKNNGKIYIHNTDLKLEPIHRATYLLFIEELEGINTDEVHKRVLRLNKIYKFLGSKRYDVINFPQRFGYKVRLFEKLPTETRDSFIKLTDKGYCLVSRNEAEDSFRGIVSDIKKQIKKILGNDLVEHYIIKNIESKYKITLEKDQIILEITLPKDEN